MTAVNHLCDLKRLHELRLRRAAQVKQRADHAQQLAAQRAQHGTERHAAAEQVADTFMTAHFAACAVKDNVGTALASLFEGARRAKDEACSLKAEVARLDAEKAQADQQRHDAVNNHMSTSRRRDRFDDIADQLERKHHAWVQAQQDDEIEELASGKTNHGTS